MTVTGDGRDEAQRRAALEAARRRGLALAAKGFGEDVVAAKAAADSSRRLLPAHLAPALEPWQPTKDREA